jgi:hypothetical protein
LGSPAVGKNDGSSAPKFEPAAGSFSNQATTLTLEMRQSQRGPIGIPSGSQMDTHIHTHADGETLAKRGSTMITIRGKTVTPKPLTLTQIGQVIDSMRTVSGATNLLDPDILPHVLQIIAMSIRPHFPGVSLDELVDELHEALTPIDLLTIVPIVFDKDHYEKLKQYTIHKDPGYERIC